MSNITKLLMLLGIGLALATASVYFVGGKKKEYDVTVTVKAQPYQLFPYLTEPEQKRRWSTALVSETLVNADQFNENSQLRIVLNIDGKDEEFKGKVIRFSPNEIVSIKASNENLTWTTFFDWNLKAKRLVFNTDEF